MIEETPNNFITASSIFEEKQDSLYKYAVMCHFHLNINWDICHRLYLESYRFDPGRPEGIFMIGYHYYAEDRFPEIAYMYLKRAFELRLKNK